jgi:hypothetical protein
MAGDRMNAAAPQPRIFAAAIFAFSISRHSMPTFSKE